MMMSRAITYLSKERTSLNGSSILVAMRIVGKSSGTRRSSAGTAKMHLGVSILLLNSPSKAKDGPSST